MQTPNLNVLPTTSLSDCGKSSGSSIYRHNDENYENRLEKITVNI